MLSKVRQKNYGKIRWGPKMLNFWASKPGIMEVVRPLDLLVVGQGETAMRCREVTRNMSQAFIQNTELSGESRKIRSELVVTNILTQLSLQAGTCLTGLQMVTLVLTSSA